MEYSDDLLNSMEKQLQVFPEGQKKAVFQQRLLYSALAEWVKNLVYGDSNGELGEEKTYASVDILYVQYHLTEIAEAFIDFFCIADSWFEADEEKRGSSLASQVIQDMIFTGNVMEIHRKLCPVPLCFYQYRKDLFLAIGDSIKSNHLLKTVGTSKWLISPNKNTNIVARKITPVVDIPVAEYYERLDRGMPWKEQELQGYYQIFKTGRPGKYSECWIPFEVTDLPQGLSMIRSCDDFNKRYFMIRRIDDRIKMAELDSWYVETREYYRILYALNYHQFCPGRCTMIHRGKFYYLKLWSALPDYEQRLLMNCSWPYRMYNDRYARIIPGFLWKIISEMLQFLGIEIEECE